MSASFVDEALKWRYSDLLFTAPLDDLADVDWACSRLSRELTPSALVTLVLHLCRLAETPPPVRTESYFRLNGWRSLSVSLAQLGLQAFGAQQAGVGLFDFGGNEPVGLMVTLAWPLPGTK